MQENYSDILHQEEKKDPMIGDFNAKENVKKYYTLMDEIILAEKNEQPVLAMKQEKHRIEKLLQEYGVQVTLVRPEDYRS